MPPTGMQGPALPAATVPIHLLEPGQRARISRIVGRPDDVHRLQEFGLCDGVQVEMFRPGTPCILRVAGNKICLRAGELLHVLVLPVAGPD